MVVYLFQNGDTDLFAYSMDKTGASIPPRDPRYVWLLRGTIPEPHRNLPAAEASRILGDLHELGFHLFKSNNPALAKPGTA